MRKVKSLVKRILGKSTQSFVTVDTVASTTDGYCIIGWFLTEQVDRVELVDAQGNNVKSNFSSIERPDVQAAIGKPAKGFQLVCTSALALDSICLVAVLRSGNTQRLPLSLTGTTVQTASLGGPIKSTSDGKVLGSCEFAIIGQQHVYINGWILANTELQDFSLQDTKGNVIAKPVEQLRINRTDVTKAYATAGDTSQAGFMLLLESVSPDQPKGEKLLLKVNTQVGEVSMPIVEQYNPTTEPMINVQRLLNFWQPQDPGHLAKADLFLPVLHSIYPAEKPVQVKRLDFNQDNIEQPQGAPKASFIIPLYGRFDFLQYQVSYFNRMGCYRDCELLYVVDDPTIVEKTVALARKMSVVCEQPFSLLLLSDNVGFGRANNIGVEFAKSEMLVLMNSDILPKTPDWLERMIQTAQHQDVGIVGARLLFEDESIQHDGMEPMHLSEYPGLYFNDHPRKGWPSDLVPVVEPQHLCPLLTAACWVIKKQDFIEVNGFDAVYVLGDFEDSDLCLKLIEKGKHNYIRRDAELYHLERQSQNLVQPGKWKHNVTVLNAVTYNKRWKAQIETMEEVTQ